jgi:hypothetical protein
MIYFFDSHSPLKHFKVSLCGRFQIAVASHYTVVWKKLKTTGLKEA